MPVISGAGERGTVQIKTPAVCLLSGSGFAPNRNQVHRRGEERRGEEV